MKPGETGKRGEQEASRYLIAQGYEILMQNYHSRYGEIDLIARQADTIVFIEVKTRRDASFMEAAQAVGRSKQEKLRKTALIWFSVYGEQPARFDVIEVYTGSVSHTVQGDGSHFRIRHIENAF